MSQRRRVRPHRWFKLSAWVRSAGGQALIELTALRNGRPIKRMVQGPLPSASANRQLVRLILQTPEWTDGLEASVILHGPGRAWFHKLELVGTDPPETRNHVLALPPLAPAHPPPCAIRRAVILTDRKDNNRLAAILRARMGRGAVTVRDAADVSRLVPRQGEAVVIDLARASSIGPSWRKLKDWADRTIVVAGLPVLARAANRGQKRLRLRLIEQAHEPLHGRVHWASYLSVGLALQDVVPLFWTDPQSGHYVHRVICRSRLQNRFFKDHNLTAEITNEGTTEANSHHPLVVHAPGRAGGLVGLDLDAFRSPTTGLREIEPWAWLLLNALGLSQVQLGQFVVPEFEDEKIQQSIIDLSKRYPQVDLSVEATSTGGRPIHALTLGTQQDGPTTVIVAGLRPEEWQATYSCLLLLKRLVRPMELEQHSVEALLAGGNVKVIPLAGPDGWETHNRYINGIDPLVDVNATAEAGPELVESQALHKMLSDPRVDAMIYLGMTDEPVGWIHVEGNGPLCKAIRTTTAAWLRRYADEHFCRWQPDARTGDWLPMGDRGSTPLAPSREGWQRQLARLAVRKGKDVVMVAVPGRGDYCGMGSVRQTDRLTLLAEHFLGLRSGLVLASRWTTNRGIRLPVGAGSPGQILIVDADDRPVRESEIPGSNEVRAVLPAGGCLIVRSAFR